MHSHDHEALVINQVGELASVTIVVLPLNLFGIGELFFELTGMIESK